MKKLIMGIFVVLMGMLGLNGAEKKDERGKLRCEFAFGDTVRTYAMYLPENIKPGAPLVVFTHGYGSKNRWYKSLNAIAEREGFAVCYPDGSPDLRGKEGWNVGYPPQRNMPDNEEAFFAALKGEVCKRFSLSRENCFMTGMSNGGDLCYQLAFRAPGLFRAYASVAGLLFEHIYLNNPLPKPVPFMEIHGDADTTSSWDGDHENKGGWGAYLPVGLAVSEMAIANRCTTISRDSFPTLNDSTRSVEHIVYSNSPYGMGVEVYRIGGGKHSWGNKDLHTEEIVWEFFSRYLAK